jgi:hypothetical protein
MENRILFFSEARSIHLNNTPLTNARYKAGSAEVKKLLEWTYWFCRHVEMNVSKSFVKKNNVYTCCHEQTDFIFAFSGV